jgi:hypothetical protein
VEWALTRQRRVILLHFKKKFFELFSNLQSMAFVKRDIHLLESSMRVSCNHHFFLYIQTLYTDVCFPYFFLRLTPSGPSVLEYNVRFGDPETQVVLPLLDSDLAQVMLAAAEGRLDSVQVAFKKGAAATVVAAAEGYPGPYAKSREIMFKTPVPEGIILEMYNLMYLNINLKYFKMFLYSMPEPRRTPRAKL